MRLEQALKESAVGAAYVSYYRQQMHPLRQKLIVWRQDEKDGPDVYVVWADTFGFIERLQGRDNDKVQGRDDWTPISAHFQDVPIAIG